MKRYWEIIADNLSKAGWSWGCVSAIDSNGRTIWIADAHRDDGKRFVVRADEKLTAFVELEAGRRDGSSTTATRTETESSTRFTWAARVAFSTAARELRSHDYSRPTSSELMQGFLHN